MQRDEVNWSKALVLLVRVSRVSRPYALLTPLAEAKAIVLAL